MRAKQLKKIKVRLEEMQAEILGESEVNQIENASSLSLSGNIRELINRFAQKLYDRIFTNF